MLLVKKRILRKRHLKIRKEFSGGQNHSIGSALLSLPVIFYRQQNLQEQYKRIVSAATITTSKTTKKKVRNL